MFSKFKENFSINSVPLLFIAAQEVFENTLSNVNTYTFSCCDDAWLP